MWEILHAAGIDPAPRWDGPTWRRFLTSQAHAVIACDMFTVETVVLSGCAYWCSSSMEPRCLHLAGVSTHPTGAWVSQQARNLTMDLGERIESLRFLIHDRDPLFTLVFDEVFRGAGMRIIRTAPKTPRMNGMCERVIGTVRRECWRGP